MEECAQQIPWWWAEAKPILFTVFGMTTMMFTVITLLVVRLFIAGQRERERMRRRIGRTDTNPWRGNPFDREGR